MFAGLATRDSRLDARLKEPRGPRHSGASSLRRGGVGGSSFFGTRRTPEETLKPARTGAALGARARTDHAFSDMTEQNTLALLVRSVG